MTTTPIIATIPGRDNAYRLAEDLSAVFFLDYIEAVTVVVKAGFVTDGASIPRLLWRVCGHPFQARRLRAAIVHDWLYAAQPLSRAEADAAYLQLQLDDGRNILAAYVEYWALRLFGFAAWRRHKPKTEAARRFGRLIIHSKGENDE